MIRELIQTAAVTGEVVELVGVLIIILGFIYAFFCDIVRNRHNSAHR